MREVQARLTPVPPEPRHFPVAPPIPAARTAPGRTVNHFNVAEHIARINAEQGITTQIRELCKLTVGAIKRSRLSYDEIKARGGPCPSTINKWDDGDVNRPFLDTLIRALVAIDERGAITALVDHLKAEQEINDRMATKV